MHTARLPARAIAALVLAAGATHALAQNYTFTRIADSTANSFDPFDMDSPSINDSGLVAFRANNLDFDQGLYLGVGGSLTTVVIESPDFDANFIGRHPAINASGQIAFPVSFDDNEAIYRWQAGELTLIADSQRDGFDFLAFEPTMNDSGMVAFQAESDTTGNALMRGDGSALPVKLITPGVSQEFGGPAIDNAGVIVFGGDSASGDGLFRYNAGSVSPVELDTGPLDFIDDIPDVNNSGAVAFYGIQDSGQDGLFLRDASGFHIIADASEGVVFLFNDAAINDAGQIVYSAYFIDGFVPALFLDGKPIIRAGDPLDGSTVTSIGTTRHALNNSGQIAFLAQLEDGRTGIYRADPAVCAADLNGDGLVDFADYLEFLNLYDAQDPRVDFNRDGIIDFADYLEFLNLFDAGC